MKAPVRLIPEPELITLLSLDVCKTGEKRMHPHRALHKLIEVGQKDKHGNRVKLKAAPVGGMIRCHPDQLEKFCKAVGLVE